MAKEWAKDGASILLITLLLLAALEIGLRLWWPDLRTAEAPNQIAYEFDPQYRVRLRPGLVNRFTREEINGGNVIAWRTNSEGMRGPELMPDPDFRIMVYGDSNVQAIFSTHPDTFAARLQTLMTKDSGRQVEVINAGLLASGPDQSLIRFKLQADTYRPDLVIFHVFADNDFGDLIRNQLFDLTDAGLIRAGNVPLDPELERNQRLRQRIKSVTGTTAIAALLRRNARHRETEPHSEQPPRPESIVQALRADTARDYETYNDRALPIVSHFDDYYDIDVATEPLRDSTALKLKLMEAVLKEANATARSKGIEFMVLIQPSAIDLTENYYLGYRYLADHFPDYDRRRLSSAVADACARNGIPFVNLYDTFLANEPAGLYFRGSDSHWNDDGQLLTAQLTAAFIAEALNGP